MNFEHKSANDPDKLSSSGVYSTECFIGILKLNLDCGSNNAIVIKSCLFFFLFLLVSTILFMDFY